MHSSALTALVALYLLEREHRRGAAAALVREPDPEAVARRPELAPSVAHWRRAARLAALVELLGLTVRPVWRLPARLRRLGHLPVALFGRGELGLVDRPAIAIVGARAASRRARAWAAERGRELAAAGRLVVSGGARGVDAAAHAGALRGGGATIAYLGVAGDRFYPECNRALFGEILTRGGALASEHPPGARTFGADHALRNRLIAAQAEALLIVEARAGSGTLGTAAFAARLGVPVFVAPAEVGGRRDGIDWLLAHGKAEVWPYSS